MGLREYSCCLVCLLFITGCATFEEHEIEIISNPPGARIEINNEYVGETPLKTTIIRKEEYGVNDNVFIVANPNHPANCQQRKTISHSVDVVPKKMFFEMNLCNQPQHYIIENK